MKGLLSFILLLPNFAWAVTPLEIASYEQEISELHHRIEVYSPAIDSELTPLFIQQQSARLRDKITAILIPQNPPYQISRWDEISYRYLASRFNWEVAARAVTYVMYIPRLSFQRDKMARAAAELLLRAEENSTFSSKLADRTTWRNFPLVPYVRSHLQSQEQAIRYGLLVLLEKTRDIRPQQLSILLALVDRLGGGLLVDREIWESQAFARLMQLNGTGANSILRKISKQSDLSCENLLVLFSP